MYDEPFGQLYKTLQPNDTVVSPSFTAPLGIGNQLIFELVVDDGKEYSEVDEVIITVVENSQPVANAGADQTKDEGSSVALDGTGSSDSDGGDILFFQWTQTGGIPVVLSNPMSSNPTFDAPTVGFGGEDLTFALVVTDNDPINPLASFPDDVTIHVANINDPPSCNLAVATPQNLWPPNHKMISVTIDGVMDEDSVYNDVVLIITGVTQDEPVNGLGDGDSSPDAVVQPGNPADTVLIRAERSGEGNGRVYWVDFIAGDGFESCTGSVGVTVPQNRQSTAIDDGQAFDSTIP